MTREEIQRNIATIVTLNGDGDLAIEGNLRKYIYDRSNEYPLAIEKLTRGGMAYLLDLHNDKYISVPPKNVELPNDYKKRVEIKHIDLSKWKLESVRELKSLIGEGVEEELANAIIADIKGD